MKLRSGRKLLTANTVHCSELPQIAVDSILRRARGRIIGGTNKYARVCRQWRDAGEDPESLQLLLDLDHLSIEDLSTAASWLSMHGQHVNTLVLQDVGVYWLRKAAPALVQLQRLEISATDELEQLVPVLQGLPQLQHLAVSLKMSRSEYLASWKKPRRPLIGWPTTGMFLTSAKHPKGWVPDMQQLCPQLTSLHLTVESAAAGLKMPSSVSQLLPSRLQQLTVANGYEEGGEPVLCASSLVHLSALQQLTLDGVVLRLEEPDEADKALQSVLVPQQLQCQQLRVYHPCTALKDDTVLVPLASKLVDYEVCVDEQDTSALTSFVHLTRLVLHGELPVGTAAAVAALTGLQELGLHGDVDMSTASVVKQAAGMAQLRSLQLVGSSDSDADVACCLAQCTQLTGLVLVLEGPAEEEEPAAGGPWVAALQQLTGLRTLTVHEWFMRCEQSAWLAALTQLTSLCVKLDGVVPAGQGWWEQSREQRQLDTLQLYHAEAQQRMAQLQSWPVALQQVIFWASPDWYCSSFTPMCWQQVGPSGRQVTVWVESQDAMAAGWARPLRPCPHLPGVWELQGPAQGRSWYQLV
jgi:hypothetical protein